MADQIRPHGAKATVGTAMTMMWTARPDFGQSTIERSIDHRKVAVDTALQMPSIVLTQRKIVCGNRIDTARRANDRAAGAGARPQ
jgi:hypothetical protein